MTASGGWSVRWATLGSEQSLTLLREGWQPFAVAPVNVPAKSAGDVLLILRRYNLPGE